MLKDKPSALSIRNCPNKTVLSHNTLCLFGVLYNDLFHIYSKMNEYSRPHSHRHKPSPPPLMPGRRLAFHWLKPAKYGNLPHPSVLWPVDQLKWLKCQIPTSDPWRPKVSEDEDHLLDWQTQGASLLHHLGQHGPQCLVQHISLPNKGERENVRGCMMEVVGITKNRVLELWKIEICWNWAPVSKLPG